MIDIFKHFESFRREDVILSYQGDVTYDLVKSILDIVEGKMEDRGDGLKTKRKVYNVLVESLQNLSHHVEVGEAQGVEGTTASFILSSSRDKYVVDTGNLVVNDQVPVLSKKLESINATSKTELREKYKEVLSNEQFSEKGGGGLGFMDIARRSGGKLNYEFKSLNDKVSFFHLNVEIEK